MGADPNIQTTLYGSTTLHKAAVSRDLEAVRILVEARAELSIKKTALDLAKILEYLTEKKIPLTNRAQIKHFVIFRNVF